MLEFLHVLVKTGLQFGSLHLKQLDLLMHGLVNFLYFFSNESDVFYLLFFVRHLPMQRLFLGRF
jgi:hypothetical protein